MLPSPSAPPAAVTRTRALFCTVLVLWAFLNPLPTSGTATPNTSTRSIASFSRVSESRRAAACTLIWNSGARPIGLDLGAVHEAPRVRIERVAPVQRAAVVPDQHVAHLPLLAEGELALSRVRPQFVEQRFALDQFHADDIAVAPPPEKEAGAPGLGMRADERVLRARRLAR